MNQDALRSYDYWTSLLDQSHLMASAAEVHGLIAGLLSAGVNAEATQILPVLDDFLNDGQALSHEAKTEISELIAQTSASLAQTDYSFALLLPSDDDSLPERLEAMVEWAQSFLVGFAIQQNDLSLCSEDVRDAVTQLTEITHIDPFALDDTSSEDNEESYYLVLEHIRLLVLTCFNEVGQKFAKAEVQNKTLH
ncbi:UPF0149 family protein [Rheinheimera sp.]|uniref:UPF0149 family protein n=1 Tax=Rheinheimera sp. TaxID=1869214 RepID=UPI003AF7BE04